MQRATSTTTPDDATEPTALERLEAAATRGGKAAVRGPKGRALFDVEGVVVGRRDFNNGFCIADVRVDLAGVRHIIRAKGTMAPEPGAVYTFTGSRESHPQYGEQLQVTGYQITRPADIEGIRRYLCSGLFPQLGPQRATFLVNALGDQTLDTLDGPDDAALAALSAIPGVTPDKAARALEAYRANRVGADLAMQLYQYPLTGWQIGRILATYGAKSVEVLKADPYQLSYDVDGFGFKTVDAIAGKVGIAKNDPRRSRASVVWLLEEAAGQGHTWLRFGELERTATKELGIAGEDLRGAIRSLLARKPIAPIVRVPEDGVALRKVAKDEADAAAFIRGASEMGPTGDATDDVDVSSYGLTAEQEMAVHEQLNARVGVLTGPPGVGKTHTLRALLDGWGQRGEHVMCAAPTGKAAVRMSESTGRPAVTMHRLLVWRGGSWMHNPENPLPAGHVVIDEASMVSVELLAALCRAIDPEVTTLTLVGDVHQLPSVGAGAILRDVIDSGAVRVSWLRTIMRQAAGSSVIANAHRILAGEMPIDSGAGDWHWQEYDNEAQGSDVADDVVEAVVAWLPSLGFDPIRDVQVLSPQRGHACGVTNLNVKLQHALNPPGEGKPEVQVKGKAETRTLRLGDKVMQTKNNYDLDVFNGEVGFVVGVIRDGSANDKATVLEVDFGTPGSLRILRYESREDWSELVPAYACTVHKFQGSEVPILVMPVHGQHSFMLGRQLFYTGVTRAKSGVVLLGTAKALRRAVKNTKEAERNTRLTRLIREGEDAEVAAEAGAEAAEINGGKQRCVIETQCSTPNESTTQWSHPTSRQSPPPRW